MVTSKFDHLSGTISVNETAPEGWGSASELPFWADPNDERWGQRLSRVLYHESIHFWQFLSSGYVANLVAEEWSRLRDYEMTGELRQPGDLVSGYTTTGDGAPFSPQELVECWARYWDVHTRSPARIIREEDIPVDDPERLELEFSTINVAYTNDAYDTVMQVGEDCAVYARPYRWLLERVHGHSAFAGICFPIIAHAAFGSPEPVTLFCRAFERAWESDELRRGIDRRFGSVNLDWLNSWTAVVGEAVTPTIAELRLPSFTSGLDVIERGPLGSHPVFAEYPERSTVRGWARAFEAIPVEGDPFGELQSEALQEAAEAEPMVVYGLPGQPHYRAGLGFLVPPPRIRFDNLTWHAHRSVVRRLHEVTTGTGDGAESYEPRYVELDARLRRFRAAEKAVSLGLPPDHFEE